MSRKTPGFPKAPVEGGEVSTGQVRFWGGLEDLTIGPKTTLVVVGDQ